MKAPVRNVLYKAEAVDALVREGRFQRALSLIAGLSSVLAGVEVAWEHYKGSYSHRVMYTPVILSGALAGAGVAGAISRRAARTALRAVSIITLIDGLIGFGFHVRGVQRKPAGWRLPVTNIVMGPPVTAPLLFGVSAYLGLIASFLRPEESSSRSPAAGTRIPPLSRAFGIVPEVRAGRFQKHLAVATILGTFFSAFEALYSHYKNRFRYRVQWTPIVLAPLLMGSAAAAIPSRWAARTVLPLTSFLAIANGTIGFFYHLKGVIERSGGLKLKLYNIMYGPPVFAPLLYSACGSMGLLASLMRRERK
ncbi:MAG: hypothetical protein JO069_03580 [Verrucomicrobia bacterium]|nr:hypothetical protein [Verrucomicrobiota bacterium]